MSENPRGYVVVCGGRDYDNGGLLFDILDGSVKRASVVHGGETGADKLAAAWAADVRCESIVVPADRDTHGDEAVRIRNTKMLDDYAPGW